jgi:DNA-directed RNA polymerase II subunit RPB1
MSISNSSSKKNEYKNPSKIIGIQFSILSPEEIRRNSVVEVISRDTYINNRPVIGGLFDPRMGVLEPGAICPTDGMSYIDTPGYFGHIELARPVFFLHHFKEIIKICRCVCYKCSKLKINKNQHKHILDRSAEDRWAYVSSLAASVKRCGDVTDDGCGCKQPQKIKVEGMATIIATWDIKENKERISIKMTPEIVLKIFRRISDDDVHFMGFSPIWSRPDWMICQVLPIAPPAVRPSVKADAQQRSEDDLTHIYSSIIKTNTQLKVKLMEVAAVNVNAVEMLTEILQHSIAMIANNKIKGIAPMAQRSGRPLQCIAGRINKKGGRIRGSLMGKRVDFSARSVITGDPNLSIQQLGVPKKIAKNITKPVIVNIRNHDFLLQLVQNGPEYYPGAKILERKTGENISLRYIDRKTIKLNIGDIVHRHMLDGDMCLFNRQPSLHRPSMMGHIAKIMEVGDTFRMNVGDTKPYNADFDGDEMNLHFAQNIVAETEIRHLAAVPYQIIGSMNNTPIIGIFQDSLLGSYRFTRPNIVMSTRNAMNLLMMFPNVDVDSLRTKNNTLTSFDVLSQIIPKMTLKYKTNLFDDEVDKDEKNSNNILEIKNGKLIRGQFDKSVLGSPTKSIIHRICNDFGNMACANFNDNLQNIITEYMKSSSFSVGISDLIADVDTQSNIINTITNQKDDVQKLINKVHLGIFENNTAHSNMKEFETQVNNILNKATEETGKKGRKSLSQDNRFVMIVASGSKGTALNISQMICCLGQQNVDAKRIPYGFDSRTLPHYSKFDDSPAARGFIENSYISGLTAPELFFHAMGGRIGLIDTAVKTSQTGYIQRRLIKGLEDLKIEYDMTVRNSKGKIIQFQYGEDGFDSMKVEKQNIPIVEMSLDDIYKLYYINGIQFKKDQEDIYTKDTLSRMKEQHDEALEKCKNYIDYMIESRENIVDKIFKGKNENGVALPVGFKYIIGNIHGQLLLKENSVVDITPLEAFNLIEKYFDKLNNIKCFKTTELFKVMYHYYLSPKELLVRLRFNKSGLLLLLEMVLLKFKEAIVHPGEMVGVVAGQSVGEPTTQLTLNTFHQAGNSSKSNVTRGVPRIEEILRLTKNPKNPSMTIYLKPEDEIDQNKSDSFTKIIEHTKLIDVVKSIQICFDPNENSTTILEDKDLLEQFYEFEKLIDECSGDDSNIDYPKSKWIIRIVIDQEILLEKGITMDDINFALSNSQYKDEIECVFADYNTKSNLVFRIRLKNNILTKSKKSIPPVSLDQTDEIYLLKVFQDQLLNNIILRGVNSIKNCLVRKLQNNVVKEDGKFVKTDIYVLDTTGSNLLDTYSLDFIDFKRTLSNDIREVFNVLGIEAARQSIYNELTEVMEFSGVTINYHHSSLLCDRMTCNKDLVPIFRSGLLNDNTGPIAKATFEVHTEVLLKAARHAEFDHMRGVSANVMTGQFGSYGTGAFQLVIDMDAYANVKIQLDTKSNEIDLSNLDMDDDTDCSNIDIINNISHLKTDSIVTCHDDQYDAGF